MGTGFALDRFLREVTSGPTTVIADRDRIGPPGRLPAPTATGTQSGRPAGPPPTEPVPQLRALRPSGAAPGTTSPSASPRQPAGGDDGSSGVESTSEGSVVLLTNAERAKVGCPALRVDTRLAKAARRHSADMAAKGYFDHNSPDGTTPFQRMAAAGHPAPGAENIAKGYPTAAAVMKGWMKSPGHRANILNCKLRTIGVGVQTGSGGPWWTQDFGWS